MNQSTSEFLKRPLNRASRGAYND